MNLQHEIHKFQTLRWRSWAQKRKNSSWNVFCRKIIFW